MASRQSHHHRSSQRQEEVHDIRELGSYEKVVAAFKKFDVNKDNRLSWAELGALMRELNRGNWDDKKTDVLFGTLDKNGSHSIEIEELLAYIFPHADAMGGTAGDSEYERCMEAFRRYDGDRNGTLDKPEFTRLMTAMMQQKGGSWNARETDKVFMAVDKDHSGSVSSEELVAWLFGVPPDRSKAGARHARASRHGDKEAAAKAGAMVVIDFECGPGAPEICVNGIIAEWKQKLGNQVKCQKVLSRNHHRVAKVSARNGEVIFWDEATMMATRDNPFSNAQSAQEWSGDMLRRHIPRLINGT